jgi:hypothetical protein
MRPTLILLALTAPFIAACKGPKPGLPSGVTIAFAAPPASGNDLCNGQAVYISDVALVPGGGVTAYALLVPYVNNNNCNNNGGQGPSGPIYVESFTLDGNNPDGMQMMSLGNAQTQTNNDFVPRLVADNSGPRWLAEGNNNSGQLMIGPTNQPVEFGSNGGGGGFSPLAMLDFGGAVYVAGGNPIGNNNGGVPDVESPVFPCCGNGGAEGYNAQFGQAGIGSGTGPAVVATPDTLLSEATGLQKDRIVGDGSNFYFLQQGSNNSYELMQFSLTLPTPTRLTELNAPSFPNPIPAGLAVGGQGNNDVVVSLVPNVLSGGVAGNGCEIWDWNVATGAMNQVFATNNFTCVDAAFDGAGSVYFVIVDAANSCSNCNNNGQYPGIGVGRVPLTGGNPPMLSALSLGLGPDDPGPRHIYVQGGTMYLVDPFTVAGIDVHALDGRQDIRP